MCKLHINVIALRMLTVNLPPFSARSGSFSQALEVTLFAQDRLPSTPSHIDHQRRDSAVTGFDFGLRVVGVQATADAPQEGA